MIGPYGTWYDPYHNPNSTPLPSPPPPPDPNVDPGLCNTTANDPSAPQTDEYNLCDPVGNPGYNYSSSYGGSNKSSESPEEAAAKAVKEYEEKKKQFDKLLDRLYELSRKVNKTPAEQEEMQKLLAEYKESPWSGGKDQPGFM